MKINKAFFESLLRHVLGAGLASVSAITATGVSLLDFGLAELLIVLGSMWAAIVPTLVRFFNKKDPAYGLVAEAIAQKVAAELEAAAEAAKPKAPRKK